ANFPTLRCVEQIRNDVCYHNSDVKIVALGGGFTYGTLGITHHATEDLAIMRSLPNMRVVAPGDPVETALATHAIIQSPGPFYLRLGRAGEPVVHKRQPNFQIGKGITIRDGSDITLITTGAILNNVVRAADLLIQEGIQVRVCSMPTLKPLDVELVKAAARETKRIVTIEEHSIIGGLGSAVAEVLAEASVKDISLRRLGIPDSFSAQVSDQEYMRETYSLSVEGIVQTVHKLLFAERPGTVSFNISPI
ncbi:transketolase, partial [Methanosarcinales archaeon]